MQSKTLTVAILFIIAVAIYIAAILKMDISDSDAPDSDVPSSTESEQYGSKILRDDGWIVIPKQEGGERVYWFVAPDENGVSPGMFKKMIHDGSDGRQSTIVSECEAPKATCDRMLQQIEIISKRYN
jgi:hypothetical protein